MKGYLWVSPVAEIERDFYKFKESDVLGVPASLEGKGWISLSASIKVGDILKVSAEQLGIRYEARVNLKANDSARENGVCEIQHGPLACVGTFVSVSKQANPLFKICFVCISTSHDGRSLLKWCIGVNDFLDADK
jgi:hypothetical protein